ncbi:CDP-glycerol glycerophosphotransferase family protein [Hominibacterium faecale]|uniref:CDP-glycerol glycerophosphotransferase family protein n=1 Tax=Hominibacterium faecale TaxID=2839743 RepID=UPI0022B29530|nr:CDP-glycerol glycerophosphotransferase family protein [Hominibacterium faecale]
MTILLKIGVFLSNLIYWFLKLLPVKKKVTFLSRQSDHPSIDIAMLADEIKRSHPDFKPIVLCRKLEKRAPSMLGYCFHMLRQMYHLATSQIIILDSYAILVSILHHRESLLIVQMWHSVGTMKKFGYSILDMEEGSSSKIAHVMKMHANYDYILAASEAYKPHLAEGFHYPLSKIVTYPLPRVELLKSSRYGQVTREAIYHTYPELQKKETILYVPTFRKGEDEAFSQAVLSLANAIDYERYNLVIKPHPLAKLELAHSKAMIDNRFTSFEMLFISDYVISDFSCIIYEAAVLQRPIYLYTYDYEHYLQTRDIYMDYKAEMPGPICNTAAEVARAIRHHSCDPVKVDAFLKKYVSSNSDHETKDIVDFVFSKKKL